MPPSDYEPTTYQVATFLRARTRDGYGNLVGDFDDSTIPNGDQAMEAVRLALADVSEAIGQDIDSEFFEAATTLVCYLAAANIELSYFPEQSVANNSTYDKLMSRYQAKLTQLQADIAEEVESGMEDVMSGGPSGTTPSGAPVGVSGGFPEIMPWGTVQW